MRIFNGSAKKIFSALRKRRMKDFRISGNDAG
jgi:hypothetical protein